MKILKLSVLSIALVTSCTKTKSSTPKPPATTSAINKFFIPNWKETTLVGAVIDNMGVIIDYDSMYAKTSGDTSLIYYKGQKLYVFKFSYGTFDSFENNASTYVNCFISPTFDTVGSYTSGAAWPAKYLDQYGEWQYKKQGVYLNKYTKFKKVAGNQYNSKD
jgi:hypothetical protein